ncbi:MAG: hypothetical protein Hals2KO_21540 [Halioglobus sp.]
MATQVELDDARKQYHRLVTGGRPVMVQKDGIRTEYTPANAYLLKSYISDLEASLGAGTGVQRRPARVL